ncbi:MAG: hypothetical protein NXH91_08165 [Phyllobacteriaceae bacterium]|jgi:uncharacterized coiled-coil protein SlyX|nr:hypothetical protein [Phyllobacteriaceae bacterium]
MDEEQGRSPEKDEPGASSEQVSWRRFGEFFANILRLERTVARLEQDNRQLRNQVTALQRMVDDHNGQLKAILATLETSIASRIESAADRAAIDAVVRLLETRGDQDQSDS